MEPPPLFPPLCANLEKAAPGPSPGLPRPGPRGRLSAACEKSYWWLESVAQSAPLWQVSLTVSLVSILQGIISPGCTTESNTRSLP
jgi:hypothetical protein